MNVGRITRVDGVRASATFYERMQPFLVKNGKTLASPRINSFVKTSVGLDPVICQITGEHEAEFDKKSEVNKPDQPTQTGPFIVDLEVRGYISGGVFKGGLRCLPIVGATVETLEDHELKLLYSSHGTKPLCIGRSLFDETNKVYLDAGRLLASHIGIFGNTGSGKSNTLAYLLKNYANLIPDGSDKARILVFDLNNEYGEDSITARTNKTIYHLNTRTHAPSSSDKIPLSLETLDEDSWGTILRATQKTQMPIIRRAYRKWKNSDINDFIQGVKQSIVDKRSTVFFTLRSYCDGYFVGIENLNYNKTNNSFYRTDDGGKYINAISDIPSISLARQIDKLDEFYLWLAFEVARASESGINFEFVQPLLPRTRSVIKDLNKLFEDSPRTPLKDLFKNKKLVVIQLGDVNEASREMLPSLLAKVILDDAQAKKGSKRSESMTTIVVDEAHNLLSRAAEQSDLVHDNTLRIFEKIIKEGRKFGVFLCLASQRPSDISPTITSQIHNYFIHKLVNPADVERIRKTVSFMGESSLSMLSALGQGECIVSGPSLYMPQYVYVEQLDDTSQPNSSDLQLFGNGGILAEPEDEIPF